jgi:hypothetical protein
VIARVLPQNYDAEGRSVFRPDLRRRGIKPTFPFGRYFSQPLTIHCESIRDLRKFLSTCRGMGDEEQFGMDDYWQPPEEFEQRRKGDCDDYALWTWRQLVELGYDTRFFLGRCTRYGIGHAWVTFHRNGEYFLLEPQLWFLGEKMPELSTVRYEPEFSVAWDGERAHWFKHKHLKFKPDARVPMLFVEWLRIWGKFWIRALPRIPLMIIKRLQRLRSAKLSNTTSDASR